MPPLFHFKKWYFDFTTPAGEVGYIYFITLRIGWRIQSLTSLQLYLPDQPPLRFLERNQVQNKIIANDSGAQILHLRFPESNGIFTYAAPPLDLANTLAHNLLETEFTNMRWTVPLPSARVAGSLQLKSGPLAIDGLGYHDFVEIATAPAKLQLQKMFWGRAIGSDWWAIFLAITEKDGRCIQRFVHRTKEEKICKSSSCEVTETDALMQISDAKSAPPLRLHLRKNRKLEEARAVSMEREPSQWVNYFYRLLSGDPHEKKYFGSAELEYDGSRQIGEAIFECVEWR
jgi:hypothetical protein